MMSPEDLLRANGIDLPNYNPGRHYTTCPQCSNGRKRGHQKLKCLGITIDVDHAHWGCNHCGWTGPQKGVGNGGGPPRPKPVSYGYGPTLRKVRNPRGGDPKYWWQHLNGRGDWEKGTGGADTKNLLYRIDEVKQAIANGETIAIGEGERDVDTLWKHGVAATCNAHGASKPDKAPKWTSAHSKQLAGADIIVFNDNDDAGYAHADAIVTRSHGVAKQIRRLDLKDEWPNIGVGNDVSDWLEKGGGTPDRLLELITAAPVITAPVITGNAPASDHEAILAELNRDNAVVLTAARTRVLRFEEVVHEAGGERYVYQLPAFLKFEDFSNFYLNRYIAVGDDRVSIGKWWLGHPERRQYRGVVFIPAGDPVIDERLNLWRGWGVEPKRGDWPLLREHMFEVLAAGDDDVDRYNLNWCAWAVQHPAEQAEVALVWRGGIGTGKGTVGNAMCRIFGQHARHLSSAEHMTGRFNAHLRQCCFLFGDECYGPKDKSAEGKLKRLITEPTLDIEPKGFDVVEEPNRLHVMLASNSDWVVPAGAHERRYAVQDVAETHRQDPNWFKPIYKEMRSGGLQAMLYDLLHYDLGDWHPRQIVRTAALAKQQEESLSPFDQWWLELLQTAVLAGTTGSQAAPDRAISNRYEHEIVETDFNGYRRTRTVFRDGLYDQARRISPKLKSVSDTALGTYLRDHGCTNAWVQRRRGWQFPPLQECRKRWQEHFPATVWSDPNTTEWTFGGN